MMKTAFFTISGAILLLALFPQFRYSGGVIGM